MTYLMNDLFKIHLLFFLFDIFFFPNYPLFKQKYSII